MCTPLRQQQVCATGCISTLTLAMIKFSPEDASVTKLLAFIFAVAGIAWVMSIEDNSKETTKQTYARTQPDGVKHEVSVSIERSGDGAVTPGRTEVGGRLDWKSGPTQPNSLIDLVQQANNGDGMRTQMH